ncbi:MAG: DUF2298 domain-containing protein [Dehalococcoidia bacterium]
MREEVSRIQSQTAAAPAAPGRVIPSLRLDVFAGEWSRAATILALAGILLLAGFLRLNHLNWDNTGHLHPDERFITSISGDIRAPSSIANYFDTDTSALNPYNIERDDGSRQGTFVYGTLPLFLNKFVATNLHTLSLGTLDNYDNYDHYNLSGRALAALFDLGTIIFVFLLGRALVSRGVGLLAAFLYAVSAFPIQNAHFFVVDPFLTFFATGAIYYAVRSAQSGGWRNFALAGACAGLAAATKITAVSLLPVVVLAIGVRAWPGVKPFVAPWWYGPRREYDRQQDGHRLDSAVATFFLGSMLALVAAFLVFRLAMPYAFKTPSLTDVVTPTEGTVLKVPLVYPDIMNQQWLDDQVKQRELLGGGAFPPNVQWIGRSKWLWPAQQMMAWGMGPALGVTAWLGVAFAAFWAVRRREGVWLVPLAWVLGYFGFMGAQFSLYMRYFLPLYPTLTVLGAALLYRAWQWGSDGAPLAAFGRFGERLAPARASLSYATRAGVGVVVLMTLLMGLAFYHIYTQEVTRFAASRWFHANVEAGAVVGHEHWDDEVPFTVQGVPPRQFGSVTFNNYDGDTPEHAEQLISNLDAVDYIALSSARLSGTIPRVPAVWPVTSRYYEALESGELGFEKAAEFTSYPSIFGFELDDTGAEESYSVYDHPKVTVYKKTDAFSVERAREVLGVDAFLPGMSILPKDAAQNGLLFTPNVRARQHAGGTWTDIFDASSFANQHPLLVWLFAIELAAFAVAPLAIVLFRALPDRGFLLSKPLGVLALSYLVYAPATQGITDFTRGWIVAAMLVLVAAGALGAWRWRDEISAFVRERWRFLLFAEALFLLAFLFAFWLRLHNPDLWHGSRGGEKPMELAYLNGVIRTTDMTQGAIDPWYADGYLNYYYYGQFISGTFVKLTGIVPEVAYNLLVPMFFALSAAAVFSLTYNLAETTRRLMKRRPGGLPIGVAGPIVAGLAGVFLVLIAGNLNALSELQVTASRYSSWGDGVPMIGGALTIAGALKEVAVGDVSLREFVYGYNWWEPSRAVSTNEPGEVLPITEFPYWTFLFADLHAHLMAIPFAITAAAVAFGAVTNFTRLARADARSREIASWLMVVVLALIVGALRWINSWDYPPFLLLGAGAILVAERAKDGRVTLRGLGVGAFKSLVMVGLSFVFFAPFIANYNQAYAGVSQSEQTSALGDFLSHFGVLLFLIGGLVVFQLNRVITRAWLTRMIFFGRGRRRPIETAPVMLALIAAGGVLVWAGTMQRWGVTVFSLVGLMAVLLAAYRAVRSPAPSAPVLLFVYAMIALGLGLTGGVELLTLDGDIGRMNTVFKFYLHVWILWGVAGAYALWYIFAVMRPQEAFFQRVGSLDASMVRAPRFAFATLAAVLLALTLVFPYVGTRARLHERFDPAQGTGINGMDYMDSPRAAYVDFDDRSGRGGETDFASTRDAINWMRANIDGTPTTIEAVTGIYHFGSRFAIYTGLPTVLGWDWHQAQQRVKFAQTVEARKADVNQFYDTGDVQQARDILQKYGVEWVIVGDVERNYYSEGGLEKFDDGLSGALELAYQNPGVQIWHVIPDEELERASATAR